MFLEITNDIHLGLKFGCCNAENRKKEAENTRASNTFSGESSTGQIQ
jgi:hypothetical protein